MAIPYLLVVLMWTRNRVGVVAFVMIAALLQQRAVAQTSQQPKGAAVIVGSVVDENHVPVARAQVHAFLAENVRKDTSAPQRLRRTAGSASTDDAGSFQISGLAAGDYVLAAEPIPRWPNGAPLAERVYGATFYPSTLDVSQAVIIHAGEQAPSPVQIELVPVKSVRVTGTVLSASGGSTEGFDVKLFRSFGGFGGGAPVATVGAKGKFEIPRVPPGKYGLIIEPHGTRPRQEQREFVETTVEVTDHDLDLSLTAGPGAAVTGRVVIEPSGAITTPIGLAVKLGKVQEYFAGAPPMAAVKSDWSFTTTGLFVGSYEFFVSSDRPPPMVVATRVVVDGTPYSATEGIPLTEGHHDVVVFVALREAPKPAVDATQTSSALVEQFRNERDFSQQLEIAKAIAAKRDTSVLPSLAAWLDHEDRHIRGNVAFIFASLGDPRGLHTIVDILADRSERPEGQGIPGVPSDGRYRFERQVASDRYYAAHLLGDLKDPRGVPLLVPLLDDRDTQAIAPWSLGQIGDKQAIAPLIAALDKDDPSQRVLVIYALEALNAKEALPRLRMLVDDHRPSRFGGGVSVSEAAKAAIAKLR